MEAMNTLLLTMQIITLLLAAFSFWEREYGYFVFFTFMSFLFSFSRVI